MDDANKKTVIINFKKLSGEQALYLAMKINSAIEKIPDKFEIIAAVQPCDVINISKHVSIPLFVQDTFSSPKHQYISYLSTKKIDNSSLQGVIINHPERKMSTSELENRYKFAKKQGMKVLFCASNIDDAIEFNQNFKCDYIVVEKENLIGKDLSFREICPEIVSESCSVINNKVLFGAGIKSIDDVEHVIEYGGAGIIVSSVIVKAEDPTTTLQEMLAF